MRKVTAAGLMTAVVVLAGCGSSGGTGLVSGTIDNDVAKTMFVGMKLSDAKSSFNGKPVEQDPYYRGGECDYYRGVNVSFSNGFSATGIIWQFCFHHGTLAQMKHVCPIPWKTGEFDRYKRAGYNANPEDCGGA